MQTNTMAEGQIQAAKKNVMPGSRKKLWFYLSIMIFPIVQFIVFYIIVNFNSLLLSFKQYEVIENGVIIEHFVGISNIINKYIEIFTAEQFIYCWKNSVLFYGVTTLSGTVFSLAFSYYIYKKGVLGNFFKIMLYLPHIVSGMVVTVMYKYFTEKGLPILAEQFLGITVPGFGENDTMKITYVMIYMFVLNFGANMLVYTGTMAGISDSIIEAGQIDGANRVQEFFHIIMPSIFSTFALFVITGMITIFNGQGNLFNFFGMDAPVELRTFGYYMYIMVKDAGINYVKYPPLASLGMCLTFIAIPLIFTLRALLNKFGPKED